MMDARVEPGHDESALSRRDLDHIPRIIPKDERKPTPDVLEDGASGTSRVYRGLTTRGNSPARD